MVLDFTQLSATLTIMITIGRWKSDAFLRYICKYVSTFPQNFTMPDFQRVKAVNQEIAPSPAISTTENGMS